MHFFYDKKKKAKEYCITILQKTHVFVVTCLIMEYLFINKDTFNGIITNYITNLLSSKQKKALIDLKLLNEIKEILLNPKDNTISYKNTCNWTKRRFKLEKITPGDYRVIVKANNNTIIMNKNMYEILCQKYKEITKHEEQKQTRKSIINK